MSACFSLSLSLCFVVVVVVVCVCAGEHARAKHGYCLIGDNGSLQYLRFVC